jgi:EAL domain-containing protein (putative c-di-GMP-specific phosphodiesterase class I)
VLGAVAPHEFIGVAEEVGLAPELGRRLLDRACRDLFARRDDDPAAADVGLTVNAARAELDDPGFTDGVLAVLERTGVSPEHLTIDVSERVLVATTATVLDQLSRLRAAGVRIAVDAAGTGPVSLAHLADLPVTDLKIDGTIVAGLDGTAEPALLRAIVQSAQALGMQTVAEGVELPVQAAELSGLGCDCAQGALFAPPVDRLEQARAGTRTGDRRRGAGPPWDPQVRPSGGQTTAITSTPSP